MKKALGNLRKKISKKFGKSRVVKAIYKGPIKKLNRYIRKINVPEKTKVDDFTMYLDKYDTLNLDTNHTYSTKWYKEFLKSHVKKGDVVLNIGANIGYYSLFLGETVGKQGKVYAFEPFPDNFNLLSKNVKVNNLSQIKTIQQAVSEKSGKAKLYLEEYNQGGHSLAKSPKGKKHIEIDITSLNDFFPEAKKIDFIFMDTEGADCAVFKGMSDIIKNNPHLKIITEFSPFSLKKFGEEPINYLKEIKKNKFKIYEIDEEREESIRVKDIESFANKFKDEEFCDLFLEK